MRSISPSFKHILILIGLAYFYFVLGNGLISLTNPDEVFYAQTAKEMMQHNSWMTPILFDAPQFEKPIFLYWLLRAAFLLFGVSSFAARLFPAVFAAAGVLAVYGLASLGFKDEKKAFVSSLALLSSVFYIGLARTVFTDMIFSVWILLALASFYWAYTRQEKKTVGIMLFFICSAFAVLTKGPLGILIPGAVTVVFLLTRRELRFFACAATAWGLLGFLAVSLPWYVLMVQRYGAAFVDEFFYNCHIRRLFEAEHIANDSWYFYPLSIVGCMFPWSLYVVVALFYLFSDRGRLREPFYLFLVCWISVVFLIFQPAHSKLASYIFPLFPALAIIGADFICDASVLKKRLGFFLGASYATAVFLLLMAVGVIAALARFPGYVTSAKPIYLLSLFWFIIGVLFLVLIVRRKILKSIPALMALIPAFFCIVPLAEKDIEPNVSSEMITRYLFQHDQSDSLILCSKFFVRGVRFYTDRDVAVLDFGRKNFFSPHPIPFLNTNNKVREFLQSRPLSYAILKKSTVENIARIMGRDFQAVVLKVIGDEYLLKIEKVASQ